MTDSNQNMQASDELTLKELILLIQEYWGVLWAKKWYILAAGLIGGLIFGIIEYRKPVTYTAELTFMVNEDEGGGLGALGGLAASFGIGGGSSEYNLEKMLSLLRSRQIIQEVVFEKIELNGKLDFYANHLIDEYELHDRWQKNDSLKNFYFTRHDINQFTKWENSALKTLKVILVGSEKVAGELYSGLNDETGIISLSYDAKNEILASEFLNDLFDELSKYYILKVTENQKITLQLTEMKRDSLRGELDALQSRLLNIQDTQRGVLLNQYSSKKLQIERDYKVCMIAYGEAVKNYEIADFALKSQTPFVQAIDRPILPLYPSVTIITILKKVIIGGMAIGFLAALGLIVSRAYTSIMNNT